METAPLTVQNKVSYGVGQVCEGVKNGAFGVFVFFYYAQVLGLSTSYTGIAIFIALLMDAITDPLIGSLSDSWSSKLGSSSSVLIPCRDSLGFEFDWTVLSA